MLPNFDYVRATSIDDAVKRLAEPGAALYAGGTDLVGCLRDHVFSATRIVSISRLDALRGVAAAPDGGLRIGALTTLADVAAHRDILDRYTGLAHAAASVGSPQLRHQGTLGGNLCQRPRCWYFRGDYDCARKGGSTCFAIDGENQFHGIFGGQGCYMVHPSDTATALVALGASVQITGPRGPRSVPLESFFVLPARNLERETILEPGEIVTHVLLPPPEPGLRSAYRKVRTRGAWDFALAGVALAMSFRGDRIQRARIVLGAAAPIPWRAQEAEKLLAGSVLDAKTAARAADAAVKGAEPLAQNEYKVTLFRGLVEEALAALA
jgi:xanthine dehydrogenase YagS FAD-binding subunit